ncbi:MAG: ribosome silencing factor [Chthoniobacteraceae bacterium]
MRKAAASAISSPKRRAKSSRRTAFTKEKPINSDKLAKLCASIAADKKAEDIVVLDLRKLSSFTDFFVICTGASEPQLKAIAGEIEDRLKKDHKRRPLGVDGYPLSQWIVADYGDVVVHIFHPEKRAIYRIEDMWNDAPRLKV